MAHEGHTRKTRVLDEYISDDYYTTLTCDALDRQDPPILTDPRTGEPLSDATLAARRRYFGDVLVWLGTATPGISPRNSAPAAKRQLIESLQKFFPRVERAFIEDHVQVLFGSTTDAFFRVANHWNYKKIQDKINRKLDIGGRARHNFISFDPPIKEIYYGRIDGAFVPSDDSQIRLTYAIEITSGGCNVTDARGARRNTITRTGVKQMQRFIAKYRREWFMRHRTIVGIELYEKITSPTAVGHYYVVRYDDSYIVTNIERFFNCAIRYTVLMYYSFDDHVDDRRIMNLTLFEALMIVAFRDLSFLPTHTSRQLILRQQGTQQHNTIVCEITKKNAIQILILASDHKTIKDYTDLVCSVRNTYNRVNPEYASWHNVGQFLIPMLPDAHNFNYRELKIVTYQLVNNNPLDGELLSQQKIMFLPNYFPLADYRFYHYLVTVTMAKMHKFAKRISLRHGVVCTYSRQPYLVPIPNTSWFTCVAPVHQSTLSSVYKFYKQTIHSDEEIAYSVPEMMLEYVPHRDDTFFYFASTNVRTIAQAWQELIRLYLTYETLCFLIFDWDNITNEIVFNYHAMGKFNARKQNNVMYNEICTVVIVRNSDNGECIRILKQIAATQVTRTPSTTSLLRKPIVAANIADEAWIMMLQFNRVSTKVFECIKTCVNHRVLLMKETETGVAATKSDGNKRGATSEISSMERVYTYATDSGPDSVMFGYCVIFGEILSRISPIGGGSNNSDDVRPGSMGARSAAVAIQHHRNQPATTMLTHNDVSLVISENPRDLAKIDIHDRWYVILIETTTDRALVDFLLRLYSHPLDVLTLFLKLRKIINTQHLLPLLLQINRERKICYPVKIGCVLQNFHIAKTSYHLDRAFRFETISWVDSVRFFSDLIFFANKIQTHKTGLVVDANNCRLYTNHAIKRCRQQLILQLLPKYNLDKKASPTDVIRSILMLIAGERQKYPFLRRSNVSETVFLCHSELYTQHRQQSMKVEHVGRAINDDSIEIRRLLRNIMYTILSCSSRRVMFDRASGRLLASNVDDDANIPDDNDGPSRPKKRKIEETGNLDEDTDDEIDDGTSDDDDDDDDDIALTQGYKRTFSNVYTFKKVIDEKDHKPPKVHIYFSNMPLLS